MSQKSSWTAGRRAGGDHPADRERDSGHLGPISLVCLVALSCAAPQPVPESKPAPEPAPKAAEMPDLFPKPSTGAQKLGGRVVTAPSKGIPLVVFRVAFQAGSIDDPKGREGLTALTAALMAEGGTKDLTSAQLLEALFPMAASIDVQTDKELTVFSGAVHKDHVARYLPLFVAAITAPRWEPAEFTRLREDAVQHIERRLRTSDDEALGKAALEALLWAGHPYGHYVGGTVQGLKAATLDDCKALASRVFTQDRMLIGVGGATDDATLQQLKTALAALPAEGAPLVDLPAPAAEGPKVLLVQKAADSTAISMGYPWALRRGHPDFYPMMAAVSALGEHRQFTGRLQRELRVKRGLNYGNYAYVEHFAQEGGSTFALLNIGRRQQYFSVWLRPVPTESGLFALRGALYQLQKAAREGLTQTELDTVKGFMTGYTLLWEQNPMRRLGYAMDEVYYGTPDFVAGFRKSLATMKLEEVNRAIKTWLRPELIREVLVVRDAKATEQAMVAGAPSPHTYATDTPDPEVVAEDARFVGLPLGLQEPQIEVRPAAELFER